MKIVGLTGGMGSGKTTIAHMFKKLGVAVYIADVEAKKLTQNSTEIRKGLVALLGDMVYENGILNRKFMAAKIFNDPDLLRSVNKIIHPKVKEHFQQWSKRQKGNYVVKEAAILFENGGHRDCDLVILVTAPKKTRVQRILAREKTTVEAIEARMKNQWSDAKKKKMADIIIENITLESTQAQVEKIHKNLSGNH